MKILIILIPSLNFLVNCFSIFNIQFGLFQLLSSWGSIEWAMREEDLSEYLTSCASFSASPKISEWFVLNKKTSSLWLQVRTFISSSTSYLLLTLLSSSYFTSYWDGIRYLECKANKYKVSLSYSFQKCAIDAKVSNEREYYCFTDVR